MVRNFLFHRVNPTRERLWDPMDVPLFEKCVKYISNKYEVVLLEELELSGKTKGKGKYATIMFDDGYKDNLEHAAPILDKYKCKASFYVVTDCIDKNVLTWTHELDYRLKDSIEYAIKLKPALKKLSHEDRNIVLKKIADTYAGVELPELMMNWNDVRELKNAGHYIGSHTVSHCMLGTMSNNEEIKDELLLSGKRIETELGYFPLTISYPVGSYNENVKSLARETGYRIGLAVNQDLYDPERDDEFEIPRIELYNESWFKTRLRISNTLEMIKKTIGYK